MNLAYDVAYLSAAVLTSPVWAYRLVRTGKWRTDWSARMGRCALDDRAGGQRRLLVHAVSVGEINSIRLLVKQLEPTGINIVISTTTDTGTARARQLFADAHAVVRFPLDFGFCVRRFLDAVRPDLVALVENEVWPNFMAECGRRSIPVCVVNGRLTERSFNRYRRIGPIARRMYRRLAAAGVQTKAYAERFESLGVTDVRVLDTMKWDTAEADDQIPGADALAAEMYIDRERPLLVAGSTGPGEEKLLIDTCPEEVQLLLVPRKPERFDEVERLAPDMVRRTRPRRPPAAGQQIFLLDTMGELRKAYALADVVVVGRSFNGLGGSDMIEPCAQGKPTIVGPDHSNFANTVAALVAGGGLVVTDQPGPEVAALLGDRKRAADLGRCARQVIVSRQGSTQRYRDMVLEKMGEVGSSGKAAGSSRERPARHDGEATSTR